MLYALGSAVAAAKPFTCYWHIDLIRVACIALALWMALLICRLLWVRYVHPERAPEPRFQRVHPAVMVSYLCFLVMSAFQREQRLGLPADVWLWVTVVALVTGAYGLVHRIGVRLPMGLAWRCEDRERDRRRMSEPAATCACDGQPCVHALRDGDERPQSKAWPPPDLETKDR